MTSKEERDAQSPKPTPKQIEILMWVVDTQRVELQAWRRNQDFIFTWVTTVFLAALAGMLALLREPSHFDKEVLRIVQWGATGVVMLVTAGSLVFLWISRINYERCARMISRVSHALGLFEPGRYMEGTVYTERWATWGYG